MMSVASLQNVPLVETIEFCADALYNGKLTLLPFPHAVFVELMQMTTSFVEFSFNNIMRQSIDGIAMGSPFGPSLANIFIGYYKACFSKEPRNLLCITHSNKKFWHIKWKRFKSKFGALSSKMTLFLQIGSSF